MAFLEVVKGESPLRIIELTGDRIVLGRHPSCEVVLDNVAVSRHHAQILESHGSYFVEDLRSRNHTYLNGRPVEGRTELADGDGIRVCGIHLRFYAGSPPAGHTRAKAGSARSTPQPGADVEQQTLPEGVPAVSIDELPDEESSDTSSIISTLDAKSGSSFRLSVKPEAKLRAIMEISNALAGALSIDDVLQKTLDGLFKVFPQADEGFALLKDPEKRKLVVKATKCRRTQTEGTVQVSMTIVKQAMQTGEAILSADAAKDSRFASSESLSSLQIRSMMCVPLLGSAGEALGVLQITTRDLRQQFKKTELDLLVSVASQVSLAVENAGMHEALLKQRDIDRDLEFATQVQLGFLPSQRPRVDGYEFCDYYEAALRVGGDYFDYVQMPDGRVVIALGDVAGKGVPAALLMARIYPSARFQLLTQPTASAALAGLNSEITSSGVGHRFITFLFAIVDPHTHEITVVNAGHWPPLLRHNNGDVVEIGRKQSGMPLGVVREQEFQTAKFSLTPGDTLTLYTDGITEAANPSGETYGSERLSGLIAKGPKAAEKLVHAIVSDVEKFSRKRQQKDDMCLVCVRRCE